MAAHGSMHIEELTLQSRKSAIISWDGSFYVLQVNLKNVAEAIDFMKII